MTLASLFHPAVAAWFHRSFAAPTAAQAAAWPAIKSGRHVLIAAPTGSGKTLAAFLAVIDELVRQGIEQGELADETQIVYVSPLKALSNDIRKNLEAPLAGIAEELQALGLPAVDIRTWVRTGDTPSAERQKMAKKPPHIVVTTPESLYLLLGSESGRKMLATTRAVIVDEIHALASNKRGTHLAVSLERLKSLCGERLLRIGLSATQKPIETVARFLTGAAETDCTIIDTGHRRARDLALEIPSSPLEAVMSHEVWAQVYDRLAELVETHRTTLIFVNTRRLAERATRQLSERIGEAQIAAHHGSLAKEARLDAEQRLKRGELKVLVATASLELGIDIGDVDLVCQIGSPRSIASFLQRVGRSGHAVEGTPKGRLFPLSRDELVECAALLDGVRGGELDALTIPELSLDVLAQQIVAEVAAREWSEDGLYALIRQAWPYRNLPRADFDAAIAMLAEGFSTRRGRRGALIHHDAVNHMLRGRRGARITALTSGGTIPDTADYQVLLEPENQIIGTVNEDWAVESLAGDVFQLGNASYRIQRVERGVVRVEDAKGAPPSVPFWLGEAPGRSDELSASVSRLRGEIAARLDEDGADGALRWLIDEIGLDLGSARQVVEYLAAAHAALGVLPTLDTLVFERFFDAVGGMQLVIHSPYGSRLNRAWGLALRKRFCARFNFELQAAATEDNISLSLTTVHSFALDEVPRYLHSASVRDVLIQALLDSPMFMTRWRWVAGVALALPRFRGGKKVPPPLARMEAEDLVAAIFPDQLACAENVVGEREIPDHPLVRQAIGDCLNEAMDIAGLERLLTRIEAGEVRVVTRDLTEPSPLALEVLSARPYAYLDDAPLEERRTQAVMGRRWLTPEDAADLGRLDPEAIARVRDEAWPAPENADEMHDALVWLGFLAESEIGNTPGWAGWLGELAASRRAARLRHAGAALWIAAERLPEFQALWPDAVLDPAIAAPATYAEHEWSPDLALVEILRGRLEGLGPADAEVLARPLGLTADGIAAPLAALEAEGFALRGRFTPGAETDEWCERRLLARVHRYTVNRLRAEIEPVAARDSAFPVRLAARNPGHPHGRTRFARRHRRTIGRARGGGRSLGERNSAGPARRLRPGLARRFVPLGPCRLGAAAAAQSAARRCRAWCDAGAIDPDHPASPPQRRAVDAAVAGQRRRRTERHFTPRHRSDSPRGSVVFRRAGRGQRAAKTASRGVAGRACRAWHRHLGQLCRAARPAGAERQRQSAAAARDQLRDGRRRPLGPGAPRPSARKRREGRRRGRRASRPHLAAALRRGVLAADRARGGVAAAMARSAARLPPAGGPRRYPGRQVCRGLRR